VVDYKVVTKQYALYDACCFVIYCVSVCCETPSRSGFEAADRYDIDIVFPFVCDAAYCCQDHLE